MLTGLRDGTIVLCSMCYVPCSTSTSEHAVIAVLADVVTPAGAAAPAAQGGAAPPADSPETAEAAASRAAEDELLARGAAIKVRRNC